MLAERTSLVEQYINRTTCVRPTKRPEKMKALQNDSVTGSGRRKDRDTETLRSTGELWSPATNSVGSVLYYGGPY